MAEQFTTFFDAAKVERIDTGDAVLALRRFGQGPALLLVHGFPLTGFTWRKLLPSLSQHFTCYVPDLAGKGDSQWNANTDFTWHGHARRLKSLVDRIGLNEYSVIGQDTGGTIARYLALADPQRLKRLVVIDSEIPGQRPQWIRLYQFLMKLPGTPFIFRQLLRSNLFLRSTMGFGDCFCDHSLIEGDFRERFVDAYVNSAEKTAGMARYLVGYRWQEVDDLNTRHAEIRAPVQLIWGEQDPFFPIRHAREMVSQFTDCRGLVSIPGAKLLVHEEKPEAVVTPMLAFLRT